MTAKGFKKEVLRDGNDFSITTYTFTTLTDSGAAQRSLHVGWRPNIKMLDLEYGLGLKSEAAGFSKQLTHAGYKRSVTSLPDLDGKSSSQFIAYKKGNISIRYREIKQDSGTLYIFSLDEEQ